MRNGQRIFELLQQTLDEEGVANEKLNEFAQGIVNPEAVLESEEFATSAQKLEIVLGQQMASDTDAYSSRAEFGDSLPSGCFVQGTVRLQSKLVSWERRN